MNADLHVGRAQILFRMGHREEATAGLHAAALCGGWRPWFLLAFRAGIDRVDGPRLHDWAAAVLSYPDADPHALRFVVEALGPKRDLLAVTAFERVASDPKADLPVTELLTWVTELWTGRYFKQAWAIFARIQNAAPAHPDVQRIAKLVDRHQEPGGPSSGRTQLHAPLVV